MSIASGRLHPVYLKINISFEPRSRSTREGTLRARMDLESITLYLAMKHLGALETHAEISSVLGQRTMGYSTRTRYLRKRSFPHSSESAEEQAKIGSCDRIHCAILQALNEQPFSSLRQPAKRTVTPATTI
jgi:hypothetical protein